MRHVTVLLLALIALGSAGCGAKAPVAPAAPVVVALTVAECPAPARPVIPVECGQTIAMETVIGRLIDVLRFVSLKYKGQVPQGLPARG